MNRETCVHHWDLGAPRDGITHGVCILCGIERDFDPSGIVPIDSGRQHGQKGLDKRHSKGEPTKSTTLMTPPPPPRPTEDEIIAVWEKYNRKILPAARELGMSDVTLMNKLKKWGVYHGRH